jgi:hypothetical protein
MAYKNSNYKPNAKSLAILARGWEHVRSIPYAATSRWLFYRLLQDGIYKDKEDYKTKFIPLFSRARHNFFDGWRPDTLADDRRTPIEHSGGFTDVASWVEDMAEGGFICSLDHFFSQDVYLEVWFEAEAMVNQFKYYTRGVTLRPFSGMPSINYKWTIAKSLERAANRYRKPIVILYFGDYDQAGLKIPETSTSDIRGWCVRHFEFVRCGLNEGDNVKYDIPENFEKPGNYQWEGLSDRAAEKLITSSITKYIDIEKIKELEAEGERASDLFDEYAKGFTDFYNSKQLEGV